jgi:hypothetical protein
MTSRVGFYGLLWTSLITSAACNYDDPKDRADSATAVDDTGAVADVAADSAVPIDTSLDTLAADSRFDSSLDSANSDTTTTDSHAPADVDAVADADAEADVGSDGGAADTTPPTCAPACSGPTVCDAGTCVPCSVVGKTNCFGICTDTNSDSANCGGCDQRCPGGTCAGGYCTSCSWTIARLDLVPDSSKEKPEYVCQYMKPGVSYRVLWEAPAPGPAPGLCTTPAQNGDLAIDVDVRTSVGSDLCSTVSGFGNVGTGCLDMPLSASCSALSPVPSSGQASTFPRYVRSGSTASGPTSPRIDNLRVSIVAK